MGRLNVLALLVALSAGLLAIGGAEAQPGTKYVNRDLHFTINFPEEPRVEHTTYVAAEGRPIPAQVFSVEDGTALYKLTVVDFSEHQALEVGATAHAVETLTRRGDGHHNRYAYMDGLGGHDLTLYEASGRRLQATVYLYDHRLYIVEGSDIAEAPLPSWFTYSLIITHADGTQLNLDGYNAESFNAFESPY